MKIVPEHINEVLSFTRDKQSSLDNLSVGKRKLIKDWLDEKEIENYIINDNLTIDVDFYSYGVNLENKNLEKIPDFIQFNEIKGDFSCANTNLITLRGCPKIVY